MALLVDSANELACRRCGRVYRKFRDVPILVPDARTAQHRAQQDYFDAEFSHYDQYQLENWRLSFIERIFGATGVLDARGPYLDVGVGGSGATVIEAGRRGVEAVGCDLSPEGVLTAKRFAKEQGVEAVTGFVVCAAESLPFLDSTFASASAVAVLEHLDDDSAAAAELARVVEPGGLVWITVPHAFRYMPPPVWPLYWWHDRRIGHKRHYDDDELTRLFADVGMHPVRTLYSGHAVKLVQFVATAVVPAFRRPRSRWWWKLEELDRRAEGRAWGALQLNMLFRRAT